MGAVSEVGVVSGSTVGVDLVHYLVHSDPMVEVNVHEAKTQLSRLLRRVEAGEEILIARRGRPIARLSPIRPPRRERVLGRNRGAFDIPDDFNAPLPDDVLASFE